MEPLYTVLYLTANVFHVYVFCCTFRALFGQPRSAWAEKLGFVGAYALNSAVFLLLNNPYFNLASSFLPLILLSFLYRSAVHIRLLVSTMACVTSMLLESIVYNVGVILISNDPQGLSIFTNIISSFILFLLIQIVKKARSDKQNMTLAFGHWLAIILVPMCIMAAVALAFRSGLGSWETAITVMLLLCINIISFWLFEKMADYYQARLEKRLLLEQNNAYAQQLQFIQEKDGALRDLRHDMKNHVNYLTDLLAQGDVSGAAKYLQQLGGQLYPQREFVSSGNDGMDSFLNYKLSVIHRLNVKITTDIAIPEKIGYSDFDLCVILGNLLDNAREALQGMPEGEPRSLELKMRYDRQILYLRIGNTYHGRLRRTVRDGNIFYQTTKEDAWEHGRGLANVVRVVESYGGTVTVRERDQTYIVELILLSAMPQAAGTDG